MSRRGWPTEVVDWLKLNIPGHSTNEVLEMIKKEPFEYKYGIVFTSNSIHGAKSRYRIKSGTKKGIKKGEKSKYSREMIEFMKKNAKGKYKKEMAAAVKEKFGIEITAKQVKYIYSKYNIQSGIDARYTKGNIPAIKGKKMSDETYEKVKRTMFKKGQEPMNKQPVGTEITDCYGYKRRKVEMPNKWEFVHKLVWKKHNGEIPEGKMIIFLDGDKENCSIENLAMISKAENGVLNIKKLRSENPEITESGLLLAKLMLKVKERKKDVDE